MRAFSRDAEIADGLDLLLGGMLAMIVGGYIRGLSQAPIESTTNSSSLTFLQAAAEIPVVVGSFIFILGIITAVLGPLTCWVGFPLYRRFRQ